jgi:hypothetical protein
MPLDVGLHARGELPQTYSDGKRIGQIICGTNNL